MREQIIINSTPGKLKMCAVNKNNHSALYDQTMKNIHMP